MEPLGGVGSVLRVCVFPDGFEPYIPAAESVFGANIDYRQLIKIYASDETSRERYSPGEVIGTEVVDVRATPIQTRSVPLSWNGRT